MITMQDLLDEEANLGNAGNKEDQRKIHVIIKLKRSNPPPFCWGHDDCGTDTLAVCAWRIDCGN